MDILLQNHMSCSLSIYSWAPEFLKLGHRNVIDLKSDNLEFKGSMTHSDRGLPDALIDYKTGCNYVDMSAFQVCGVFLKHYLP